MNVVKKINKLIDGNSALVIVPKKQMEELRDAYIELQLKYEILESENLSLISNEWFKGDKHE